MKLTLAILALLTCGACSKPNSKDKPRALADQAKVYDYSSRPLTVSSQGKWAGFIFGIGNSSSYPRN